MASDPLSQAVRRQLRLGRLLPLGAREDGAWLAERAAGRVLRRAVEGAVADVRLDGLRLALAPREEAQAAVVPPPPSALPPGPLRIEAECAAGLERPLPECVREVRAVLAAAARDRIGLELAGIDVHVAGLLEAPEGNGRTPRAEADEPLSLVRPGGRGAVGDAVADAVLAVPGVLGLSGALGGPSQALRVLGTLDAGPEPGAHEPGVPGRLVRLQLAVDAEHRTVAVAREARAAAAKAAQAGAPGPVAVAVLVAEVAERAEADPEA
jgi:hypothetical protein